MGQQQSNIKDQLKNKYNIIKTIAAGEYLVKGRRKGEELQLRILNFLVEDEMAHYINLLEKRKKIKNPHLLELIQYSKVIDQMMCSSTFKLKIISEMPFQTIKKDIQERATASPKKYFSEDQLWSILYSCCHALYSLYINKFPHQSLTTQQIYIDTEGIIKVADNLLVHGTKNYLSLMNQELKLENIRYISPQLRNLVDDNNFYHYDRQKSDVYIMAMIILEISNLAPLRYFEPKTKRFYFDIVQSVFSQFKEKYSPKLCEIVSRMLTSDYNIRPSFEEIIENINQKTVHTDSNMSSKDSTIINDAKKEFSQKSSKPALSMPYAANGLNQVKERLNFDLKPTNSIINQQIQPPQSVQPASAINFNNYLNYQSSISNNLTAPAPPLFTGFANPPAFPPMPPLKSYQPVQIKPSNQNGWKFDTVSKDIKRQNDHQYTPYQQLLNLSGNASIPNSHIALKQDNNYIHTNGIYPNVPKIEPTSVESTYQRSMKERRFSQSKFGGIELGLPTAQVTEKKQARPAIQKYGSFTQSKPLSTTASQLFRKERAQQDIIVDKGTFVIEENSSGRYEGFKQNNQKNGIGRIIYADGGSYEGQWKNNRMDGYGKLFYPNGKTAYEGYWVQDEFNGTGRVYNEVEHPNQKISINYLDFSDIEDKWEYYEGEFNRDLREGKGMIKFINGEKFFGTFRSDMIQGEGVFHKKDGDVIQGTWRNNAFVSA